MEPPRPSRSCRWADFRSSDRVTISGNMVVREGWYCGQAAGDFEGWSVAGQEMRHKTASFYLFDDGGLLLEWVDYG